MNTNHAPTAYGSQFSSKQQLQREVELTEKILMLAHMDKPNEAEALSIEFMKIDKAGVISSIDVSEYLGYLADLRRHKREGDQQKIEGSELSIRLAFDEIQGWLRTAKRLLGNPVPHIPNDTVGRSGLLNKDALEHEIVLAEQILELAQAPGRLTEVESLIAELAKTQQIGVFSVSYFTIYVQYLHGIELHKQKHDMQKVKRARNNADTMLTILKQDLAAARDLLTMQ